MPSKINLVLLSAAMLAALQPPCASGAPLEDAQLDIPAGDTSGEMGEETSEPTTNPFTRFTFINERHKKKFEEEFQAVPFSDLDSRRSPLFPENCPDTNFSKEACLQRLAQGLLTYTVLLKHVEKEYPNSQILSEVRGLSSTLYDQVMKKMKNKKRVTPVTRAQEEQMLTDVATPDDPFSRKMMAHSIMRYLANFVFDGKRSIRRREKKNRSTGIWHSA